MSSRQASRPVSNNRNKSKESRPTSKAKNSGNSRPITQESHKQLEEAKDVPKEGESRIPSPTKTERLGDEDEYDEIEVEEEEPITKAEYYNLQQEAIRNNPDFDIESIPKIRKIKKIVKQRRDKKEELNISQDPCILFIQDKIELDKYNPGLWRKEFNPITKNFLKDWNQMIIFFWVDKNGLNSSNYEPPKLNQDSYDSDFCYFLKKSTEVAEITEANIENELTYGIIGSDHLKYLLKIMSNQYIPSFMADQSWPENVKKEFIAQLHKFMATLTEIAFQRDNMTKLYIPNEDLSEKMNPVQDKDLIQRLESILLHWIRQIKEIVSNQESSNENELAGPIDEIKHWTTRQTNLSDIKNQLEKPELQKIIEVLQEADSSYLGGFRELEQSITKGSIEAEDNLKFLKSLHEPCKRLGEAKPKEIPSILPQLLHRVRMISDKSTYYNQPDQIISLLRKISNEIIKRCKDQINLEDMLDGDVEKCMQDLNDSIECGKQWSEIYTKTAKLIDKKGKSRKWDFNKGSIFAQIDAFVQRCNDLKEICEGQLQFARKGKDTVMPVFGGTKGPEIVILLEEIKVSFRKHLEKIRNSDKNSILDVKSTKWHEDYNTFKAGMKELDNRYENIIILAFKNVTTVEQGVELLEAFHYLAKRRSIKESVQKRAQQVYDIFEKEVEKTDTIFKKMEGKADPLIYRFNFGKHSGTAIWIRSLLHRLEKLKASIEKLGIFDDSPYKASALQKYDSVFRQLKSAITDQKFKDWRAEIKELEEGPISSKLDRVVLIRADHVPESKSKVVEAKRLKPYQIESNFDQSLMKLIIEVSGWKKLIHLGGLMIPPQSDELVTSLKESLRVLRELVMLVVKEYNQIIDEMEDKDSKIDIKKLLAEHLANTDHTLNPGLTSLKWSSKTVLESFVGKCKRSCSALHNVLKVYKSNTEKIYNICKSISEQSLIDIDRKFASEVKVFSLMQERCRKKASQSIKGHLDEIKKTLGETYEFFFDKKDDIQNLWFKYVSLIDTKIEESLKKAVRLSLIDLNKSINGDGKKKATAPIFKLSVVLNDVTLDFDPSRQFLQDTVKQTISAITELTSAFARKELEMFEHRIKKYLEAEKAEKETQVAGAPFGRSNKDYATLIRTLQSDLDKKKLPSFYENIAGDSDIKKLTVHILTGLEEICKELVSKLDYWKKTTAKFYSNHDEKFARKMVDKNTPLSTLKSEIENYGFIQDGIQGQKSTEECQCIQLDNTTIKNQVIEILVKWQTTQLNVIQELTLQELYKIYDLFKTSADTLGPTPNDLYHLKKNMDTWQRLTEQKPAIEAQLPLLKEKFKLLDEYAIQFKEEDMLKRQNLDEEWAAFNVMMEKIQVRNTKVYAEMNAETIKSLDQFMKETGENKKYFQDHAPYTTAQIETNEKAFSVLNDFRDQAKTLRRREESMKFGFDLFKIHQPPNPDLDYVEKEIENLEEAWGLKNAWDNKWKEIKAIKFKEVDIEDLDEKAEEFLRKINEYPKEMKKWEVVSSLRSHLEQFRSTLPLIGYLGEKCIRDRHWEDLKLMLNRRDLNHHSENFNLEEVFNLGLIQYAEPVRETAELARRQFQIETTIEGIEKKWGEKEIKLDQFKQQYYIMKNKEEIEALLEDHLAVLASMKTLSQSLIKDFEGKMQKLENNLTKMQETLEILVSVQGQWIHLEALFTSVQGELDRQLLGDLSKFKTITEKLKSHMLRIKDDRNAIRALCYEGFYKDLQELNAKLDVIQKILVQLLEKKRGTFPRFYFLSNSDLFELLGQSKDPRECVNKHIKKCFEGIKSLSYGEQLNKIFEVNQLNSPDGEVIKLASKVQCENAVEIWLSKVEFQMFTTLKGILTNCLKPIRERGKEFKWVAPWVSSFPGQLLITSSQIVWTTECDDAILKVQNGLEKGKAWKAYKDFQKRFLEELTKLVRKPSSDLNPAKLVALITIEIHARDIIEKLYKTCTSPNSFEWKQQLRFKSSQEGELTRVTIEQTDASFAYGYEYQGNNGRLVITPLTDRCYLTLTTAMNLKRGGAPQGPAGTGKTETVKDLGKGMAKFVYVFNCSEGLEYKSLGRMFSGLVQTGTWGCFDEFNRIEVEVLSVVATQINSILNALKAYSETNQTFMFEGSEKPSEITLNPGCAIFITMNPGYAGRSELPDNLKSLFRPISMIVPDAILIGEVMLASEGFRFGNSLSKKIMTLYHLMIQQLSKQDHYDFGLRAIKSVLNCAGALRREKPSTQANDPNKTLEMKPADMTPADEEKIEQIILMKAIRDMNLPKFVAEDVPLFNALFNDLFPGVEMPEPSNFTFQEAIEEEMRNEGLQPHSKLVTKVVQLYDTKKTRHGIMLIGSSLSGKSTTWKMLAKALNRLNKELPNEYNSVTYKHLNPKSVDIKELFGWVDSASMDWNPGVLSFTMNQICEGTSSNLRWLILDGPVDTLWIESLNTVLDDNKVLTLLNGDRINLPPQITLIFEVEDLSVASPATVSRVGMVYLDINDLGWRPYAESWIDKKKDNDLKAYLTDLFDKWVPNMLKAKKLCADLVKTLDENLVISLCKLLDSLAVSENGINFENPSKTDEYWLLLEKWFAFAVIWSMGATVDEAGRKILDYKMRDIESFFPHTNTVYEYFINIEKNEWANWEEKIVGVWKPPADIPFYKYMVPTIDTVRNRYILDKLITAKVNTLIVGMTGTGKTALIKNLLPTLPEINTSFTINFSSQSTSKGIKDIIEGKLVRRTKTKMIPDAGKKAVIFLDDLNLPKKDKFGSQPPLELIRQYIDYEGWYDRQEREIIFKFIIDIQLLAAMGKPGGSRAEISQRIQSKFNMLNFTSPSDTQVKRIFQSILGNKLVDFDEEIKPLAETLTTSTIQLYKTVSESFLPTPTKVHYFFNMRDLSKIFQGLCQVDRYYCDTKVDILKLWVHECLRVFHDRLVSVEDRTTVKRFIGERLEQDLQSNLKECMNQNEEETIFVDFMDENTVVYQEADPIKLKEIMEEKLAKYNEQVRGAQMNIVLFKEAINTACRIYRILKLARGHALLIGEGGSGRHCLTKLAAHIAGYRIYQIEISKNYRIKEFREDLRKYCEEIGTRNRHGVFIFSDNEIVNEAFLEDVNNLITAGEIPNLFTKDELITFKDKVRKDAKVAGKESEDAILEFFQNRIQSNLHVAFCMSQTGDNLRNYVRMYPGLVNNTTIIWFMPWSGEALIEVAFKFIRPLNFAEPLQISISNFFGDVHTKVLEYSYKMLRELKRLYYVTPTNYIELVKGYVDLLQEKRIEVGNEIKKLADGLGRLDEAGRSVEDLSKLLEIKLTESSAKQKECEDLLFKISQDQRDADEKQKVVEATQAIVAKSQHETEELAREARADLEKAEPALRNAEKRIEALSNKELAEIKAYSNPAIEIVNVMSVVLIFLGVRDVSWTSCKKELADSGFLQKLKLIDRDGISNKTILRVEKYTSDPNMDPAAVSEKSSAAGELWQWALAMEKYAKAFRDVEPKRIKVNMLNEKLKKSQEELKELSENFQQLKEKINNLNAGLIKTQADLDQYNRDANDLKVKLDRAEKLVSSLSTSKTNWSLRKKKLEEQFENLIGDSLISAAFLSYSGPFPSEYRDSLVNVVMLTNVRSMKIPHSKEYQFSSFMAQEAEIQKWNQLELPSDPFSIENGILVLKGRRWPLMIDPQLQANRWIKNMEKEKLIIVDPQTENYMTIIEKAIFNGSPVLFQNLSEEVDPSLEPILNKSSIKKVAGSWVILLGDKEVSYNMNFRFYMSTKYSNPKYKAEVSTKVTLVNFTVKEKGLEEQLLGKLIEKQEPHLEKTKNELVQKKAKNLSLLKELDDKILKLLQDTKGSLVEDESLIKILQSSKETEDEINQQLASSIQTMNKTTALRENYRPSGALASELFFVVNDLNIIDHMYQTSLDSYINLFINSIEKAKEKPNSDTLPDKLKAIDDKHKSNVYQYACRGLFEKDKILLSMQLAIRIAKSKGELNMDDYNFFLRGPPNIDRSNQLPKPADWLSPTQWDTINELDKLTNFVGIVNHFMHNIKEWKRWYTSSTPETDLLPGDWSTKLDDLGKMILLKCIRSDRVLLSCRTFIINKLGSEEFVNPPPINLEAIYNDSRPSEPIIFVLSPGVDPKPQVVNLAQLKNSVLVSVSLGQGQTKIAREKIIEGAKLGHWVFLANCHLSLGFLVELEKLLEQLKFDDKSTFRLWLTSSPTPKFPISILQRSIKITTEPPKGIKANMLRLYTTMPEENFTMANQTELAKYKKLLFSLCWFHSIIIERKRFKSLGWNIIYDFNDSDFEICKDILFNTLEKNIGSNASDPAKSVPWDAIRYLIAEANYGGRVTDDWDRRLLLVYANEFFNEKVILEEKHKLAEVPIVPNPYIVPDDQGWKPPQDGLKGLTSISRTAAFYEIRIKEFPVIEHPEAFGQHINAEISSQIQETTILLESILSLQPRTYVAGEESRETAIEKIVIDLLQKVPEPIDMSEIHEKQKNVPNDSPLKIVLLQELARYNKLIFVVRSSLENLDQGIKGYILISEDLEKVMNSLYENRVPEAWKYAYHSLKSLSSWIEDFNRRVKEMLNWAIKGQPNVFWISGFTFPTGFTTAILQQTARRYNIPIDSYTWEHSFLTTDTVSMPPKDGAYITGLFLEGGRWDIDKSLLVDADPMILHYKMPIIHFKPSSEGKSKTKKNQNSYNCPCYMYPIRTIVKEKPSFMFPVLLPCISNTDPSYWVKRGTALLMSLAD